MIVKDREICSHDRGLDVLVFSPGYEIGDIKQAKHTKLKPYHQQSHQNILFYFFTFFVCLEN